MRQRAIRIPVSMAAWACCVGVVLAGAAAHAQSGSSTAKVEPLTALDYAEIQQLNARYGHFLDSCSNNGYDYADLYTPDGEFTNQDGVKFAGRERLVVAARGAGSPDKCPPARTPLNIFHVITNVMIDPAPGGAYGKSMLLHTPLGAGGKPNMLGFGTGGMYYDFYVKTPNGWRIKTRNYVEPPREDLIPPSRR